MDGMIQNQRWLVEDRLDRYRSEAMADRLAAAASRRDAVVPQLGRTDATTDPVDVHAGDVHAFGAPARPAPASRSVEGGHRAGADCRCPEGIAAA
jgi:hypothetical protein